VWENVTAQEVGKTGPPAQGRRWRFIRRVHGAHGLAHEREGHKIHSRHALFSSKGRPGGTLAGLAGLFLLTPLACVIDHDTTEIELDETDNVGVRCGEHPDFSWTVYARETGEQATAGCEQPIRFVNLVGGATYTFDITGYSGPTLCWRAVCSVRARDGIRVYASCRDQIKELCTF